MRNCYVTAGVSIRDNTNWRTGGPVGQCFQMEKLNFQRAAAHKTKGQAGGLHKKGGPLGCGKGRGGLQKRTALRPILFRNPPDRLNVQPTCPSCGAACRPTLLCSSPVRGKFMFFIWQHSPPARPALRLVLSINKFSYFKIHRRIYSHCLFQNFPNFCFRG